MSLKKFLESPSNRSGLSIWVGTIITILIQVVLLHMAPSSADLLGLVLGLVKIIQPENGVTAKQLQKAISDLSTAITFRTPDAVEATITDAKQIVSDVIQDPKHS